MPEDVPTIDLNSKKLAEVKDWEVGKTYKVMVELEVYSKRSGGPYEQNKDTKIGAKINSVKCMGEGHEMKETKKEEKKEMKSEYSKSAFLRAK